MSGLTDADRESLGCTCPRLQGERRAHRSSCPAPAVEAIVQRAVCGALSEAADAIDAESRSHMFAANNKMRPFKERDEHYGAQLGSERAARIVRAHIPT